MLGGREKGWWMWWWVVGLLVGLGGVWGEEGWLKRAREELEGNDLALIQLARVSRKAEDFESAMVRLARTADGRFSIDALVEAACRRGWFGDELLLHEDEEVWEYLARQAVANPMWGVSALECGVEEEIWECGTEVWSAAASAKHVGLMDACLRTESGEVDWSGVLWRLGDTDSLKASIRKMLLVPNGPTAVPGRVVPGKEAGNGKVEVGLRRKGLEDWLMELFAVEEVGSGEKEIAKVMESPHIVPYPPLSTLFNNLITHLLTILLPTLPHKTLQTPLDKYGTTFAHLLAREGNLEGLSKVVEVDEKIGWAKDVFGRSVAGIGEARGWDGVREVVGGVEEGEEWEKFEAVERIVEGKEWEEVRKVGVGVGGGWDDLDGRWEHGEELSGLGEIECTIPSYPIDALPNSTVFLSRHFLGQQPAVFRQAANAWPFRRWKRSFLVQGGLGLVSGRVASFPYDPAGTPHTPLTTYLSTPPPSPTQYFFEAFDTRDEGYHDLLASTNWPIPPLSHNNLTTQTPHLQFGVGPAGSGAPLHDHLSAINALGVGKKLWAITKPAHTSFTQLPAHLYFKRLLNPNQTAFCVQNPGDIIFIPANFGHAILNLKPSITIAAEFTVQL